MKRASERLPELLPSIHSSEDGRLAERPLRALLEVLGGELDALDLAIDQLYADHFVERASPEGLLLLAELLGVRLLGGDARAHRGLLARAVAFRRRKGTLATLEEIVSLASGYDAEVDEGYRSLLFTQDLGDLLPYRGRTTTVIDPIALADPLSRVPHLHRPGRHDRPGEELLAARPGESTDDTLRRLGRADAGRAAVSPRFVDLRGFARPEGVLVRTARLVPFELENITPGAVRTRADGRRVVSLDPLERPTHVVWQRPHDPPERIPRRTIVHERLSGDDERSPSGAEILTPTALAADAEAVELSGALAVAVEGIPLVGPEAVSLAGDPMLAEPPGPRPRLRFADPGRPCAGDAYELTLLARAPSFERALMHAEALPSAVAPPVLDAAPDEPIAGMTIALRIERTQGTCAVRRDATQTWEPFAAGPPLGPALSAFAAITVDGNPYLARLERVPGGGVRVVVLDPVMPATFTPIDLGGDAPPESEGMSVVAEGDTLYVAVPTEADGLTLHAIQIALQPSPAATVTWLDQTAPKRPRSRRAPAVAKLGDRIYLFGGIDGEAILGDLWSFSLADSLFRPHFARHGHRRAYATLVPQFGGLVLLGGEEQRGILDPSVALVDPAATRPIWRRLQDLPIVAQRPGLALARTDGAGLFALVWADRTRPAPMMLAAETASWTAGPVEGDLAPNPPAHGDAVFVGAELFVAAAPPLPPSEVLFSIGGRSRLAFLPGLDLAVGESRSFLVDENGATQRLFALGETASTFTRLPYDPTTSRPASALRLSVAGRLGVSYYRLRQRILGAWDDPALLPDDEDAVGLDARDGRVILPSGSPPGDLSVSYRRGAGAAIGAGPMPPDRSVPPIFREPGAPPPVPPDLGPLAAPVTAWVFPARAGLSMPGSDAPIVSSLAEAVAASSGAETQVIAVDSSAYVSASRVASLAARSFTLVAADFGDVPFFAPQPGSPDTPVLAINPDFGGQDTTELWLAGLWLGGRLDLEMARGRVDLRYCTIGRPGAAAVRVAGAQHQVAPMRRSLHVPELTVAIHGCVLGSVEVPPWVHLVAAGCTFDGGGHDSPAVSAAGATVHLRHCTVRGTVEAGALHASSCAFSGAVSVDRPDLGWIRWSLLRRDRGRPPRLYHSPDHPISFASIRETDPHYLVLADNNGAAALAAGEMGRVPGAHAERTERLRELAFRTESQLPMGLIAHHQDKSLQDLSRMRRSST